MTGERKLNMDLYRLIEQTEGLTKLEELEIVKRVKGKNGGDISNDEIQEVIQNVLEEREPKHRNRDIQSDGREIRA